MRSQVAKGKIVRIGVDAARAVPGVVAVYTGADINGLVKSMRPCLWPAEPVKYPRLMALADQDVRFTGDCVALVVAEDRYIAEDAAEVAESTAEEALSVIDVAVSLVAVEQPTTDNAATAARPAAVSTER